MSSNSISDLPQIRQTLFHVNIETRNHSIVGRDYQFDVNQNIKISQLKKMIAAAAFLDRKTLRLFHEKKEYTQYDINRLDELFPNLQLVEFDCQIDHNAVLPREEDLIKLKFKPRCIEHPGKFATFYCFSCGRSICSDCLRSGLHQNHNIKEKYDYLENSKKLVEDIFRNVKNVSQNAPTQENVEKLKAKVSLEFFSKLVEMVREIEGKMLNLIKLFLEKEKINYALVQQNGKLLKQNCIEGLDKLKEEIDIGRIMLDEDVFLTFDKKIKEIEGEGSRIGDDLKKYNEFCDKLFLIENVINKTYNEIYTFLLRYLDAPEFDEIKKQLEADSINIISKKEVFDKLLSDIKKKPKAQFGECGGFCLKDQMNQGNVIGAGNRNYVGNSGNFDRNTAIFGANLSSSDANLNNFSSGNQPGQPIFVSNSNDKSQYDLSAPSNQQRSSPKKTTLLDSGKNDEKKYEEIPGLPGNEMHLRSGTVVKTLGQEPQFVPVTGSENSKGSQNLAGNVGGSTGVNYANNYGRGDNINNNNNVNLNDNNYQSNDNDIKMYEGEEEEVSSSGEAYQTICNITPGTKEVTIYNVDQNKIDKKWPTFPAILGIENFLGDCSWVNLNNKVYILGGIDPKNKKPSNVFLVYDPIRNTLKRLEPSKKPHASHSLFAYDDCIYSVGGLDPECEKYDISTNTWTSMSKLNFSQRHPVLYVHKDFLYSFFGLDENDEQIDLVQRINLKNIRTKWATVLYQNRQNCDLMMYGCGIVKMTENTIYFLGGRTKEGPRQDAIQFDFGNMSASKTNFALEEKAYFKDSVLLKLSNDSYGNFSMEENRPFLKISFLDN